MQGKESIAVDITTPEGLEIVYELVDRADVVLQSFQQTVGARMGRDHGSSSPVSPATPGGGKLPAACGCA
jgi:crotonobetainyl-CoA:carnitine CoA-transferase CaiB-like acyl-CoA transferase